MIDLLATLKQSLTDYSYIINLDILAQVLQTGPQACKFEISPDILGYGMKNILWLQIFNAV